jgi:ribonuclease P protein component
VGLPAPYRLKHWRAFERVYKQGRRYHGRYLTLTCLAIAPLATTQIGIAVGKRVSKKAVERNRLKRRVREAFRELLPQLKRGYHLVVNVKTAARECEYEHFLRELEQLLMKAEVWDGHQGNRIL